MKGEYCSELYSEHIYKMRSKICVVFEIHVLEVKDLRFWPLQLQCDYFQIVKMNISSSLT